MSLVKLSIHNAPITSKDFEVAIRNDDGICLFLDAKSCSDASKFVEGVLALATLHLKTEMKEW